jgi:hypothetical protein
MDCFLPCNLFSYVSVYFSLTCVLCFLIAQNEKLRKRSRVPTTRIPKKSPRQIVRSVRHGEGDRTGEEEVVVQGCKVKGVPKTPKVDTRRVMKIGKNKTEKLP